MSNSNTTVQDGASAGGAASKRSARRLITAGLPYSNGKTHVGHLAGAYLPADIYTRFSRMVGVDALYICGSDDHGVAIQIAAEKEGVTPQEIVRKYRQAFESALSGMGIEFDIFSSTSLSATHHEMSREFFLTMHEKGLFEKESADQFYDPKRGQFLPDRYVLGRCSYCKAENQNSDQCEQCGKQLDIHTLEEPRSAVSGEPAEVRPSTHWYLDLSRSEQEVREWMGQAFLRDGTKSFVKGLVETGLVKRCMTRDLSWGIPVPLDDPDAQQKVLYVWFDAPIGYISFTKELCEQSGRAFADWWQSEDCQISHFIGEDNTVFHCIIWIAMLSAEGHYQLPSAVVVNHFVNRRNADGSVEKFSKSKGNAILVEDYLASGRSVDALRYYLTATASERARTSFSPEEFVQRVNSELGNTLGNFINRILSFTIKHAEGKIPEFFEAKKQEQDEKLLQLMVTTHQEVERLCEAYSFRSALEQIMEFARACNKYVDELAPWTTRKSDLDRTMTTLHVAIQAIQALGVMLTPFLPETSRRIARMLGSQEGQWQWQQATQPLSVGSPLGEVEILFDRIEPWEEVAE